MNNKEQTDDDVQFSCHDNMKIGQTNVYSIKQADSINSRIPKLQSRKATPRQLIISTSVC